MTARFLLLIAFAVLSAKFTWAQSNASSTTLPTELSVANCTFNPVYERQTLQQEFQIKQATSERKIYQRALQIARSRNNGRSTASTSETLTLPMVIHIIHSSSEPTPGDGPSNPDDAQIMAGIDHLNQAFRNIGLFAENGHYDHPAVQSVEVGIEFCLAQSDGYGNPTTGVLRYASDQYTELNADQEDPGMQQWVAEQNGNAFPSTDYINVWLVRKICRGSGTPEDPLDCNKGGYGYYPATHGNVNNGVVNLSYAWGISELTSIIHIHEFGHYLGLYHTFQGGCPNGDCLKNGDRVCDTPPDSRTSFSACGEPDNSCQTDADDTSENNPFQTDVDDLYENYMDYTSKSCQNTFTQGQADRMRSVVMEVRHSLLQSKGCTDADDLSQNQPHACSTEELVLFMDQINSGAYDDAEVIYAAGKLEEKGVVIFHASETISLLPGFKVTRGTTFKAALQACQSDDGKVLAPEGIHEASRDLAVGKQEIRELSQADLRIAPNPVEKQGRIRYYLPKKTNQISLILMDVNGRKIHDLKPAHQATTGWQQVEFTTGDLPPGMYFLMLRVEDQLLSRPVVVVH